MPKQEIKLGRTMNARGLLRLLEESRAVDAITADLADLVTLADVTKTVTVVAREISLVDPDSFTLNLAVHLAGQGKSTWHQFLWCNLGGKPVTFRLDEVCPGRMRLKRTSSNINPRDQQAVQETLANFAKTLFEW